MNKHSPEESVRFEPRDVPPLLPLWLAAGLAGFVIIVLGGIALGYPLANRQENRGPTQPLPPMPRLQPAPASDLSAYRAAKLRELENSPVPIEVAMQQTAQQGWGPPK
ncbi:MAG TPA: hypothetical protein VE968_01100 [Sphingomicrobium sp.]|nr:hypothetical protein [Sphingomicrobium sp.]